MTLPPRTDARPSRARSRLVGSQHLESGALLSVAGLRGCRVHGPDGDHLGVVVDVVARSEAGHPQVAGLLVRVGTHRVWIGIQEVAELSQKAVTVRGYHLDLRRVDRRPGEILLVKDVLDHQVVDVEGIRVWRASDVYLVPVGRRWRVVGVDVSWRSYLRRAMVSARGRRPRPGHVLDWAGVRPLAVVQGSLRLDRPRTGIHLLRPSELAALLDEVGRVERLDLLQTLDPQEAARVLELMAPQDVAPLLRDASPERASRLIAALDREHAVRVLRRLTPDEQDEVLSTLEEGPRRDVQEALAYEQWTAGGLMTGGLVTVTMTGTVGEAVEALRSVPRVPGHPAVVVVVDDAGRLVDDISVFELLGVPPERPLGELVGPPWPVTVEAHATLRAVISALEEGAGSSVLVVDQDRRPIGRVIEHEVMQALLGARVRHWPWQRGPGTPP